MKLIHILVNGSILSYEFNKETRQATCVYKSHFFTLNEIHPSLMSQIGIINYVKDVFK